MAVVVTLPPIILRGHPSPRAARRFMSSPGDMALMWVAVDHWLPLGSVMRARWSPQNWPAGSARDCPVFSSRALHPVALDGGSLYQDLPAKSSQFSLTRPTFPSFTCPLGSILSRLTFPFIWGQVLPLLLSSGSHSRPLASRPKSKAGLQFKKDMLNAARSIGSLLPFPRWTGARAVSYGDPLEPEHSH